MQKKRLNSCKVCIRVHHDLKNQLYNKVTGNSPLHISALYVPTHGGSTLIRVIVGKGKDNGDYITVNSSHQVGI